MKNKKKIQTSEGFTLIELLLVIAIIAVLASAILVMISGQREQARVSKVVLELSGTIQPIMMCRSDDGTVGNPGDNNDICSAGSSYGSWPDLSGTALYGAFNVSSTKDWYFRATVVGGENIIVCCNAKNSGCGISASGCDNTTNLE